MTRQYLHFLLKQAFGKFLRYPGIWEISQILMHLGNFPDTKAFGKFPRYPGIWEIPQIPVGI